MAKTFELEAVNCSS